MNIDARLQWILDNLKQPSGDAWNQKALARAMGLPSLALGAPKPLVRRAKGDAVSLAAATGLPVWACELRLAAVRAGLG